MSLLLQLFGIFDTRPSASQSSQRLPVANQLSSITSSVSSLHVHPPDSCHPALATARTPTLTQMSLPAFTQTPRPASYPDVTSGSHLLNSSFSLVYRVTFSFSNPHDLNHVIIFCTYRSFCTLAPYNQRGTSPSGISISLRRHSFDMQPLQPV